MCKVSQCGVRNVLRDFIFILFWRLRWWSKGILSFKCQMSQRRKKDNLGIRRFWKINGQKKTNNLSIIMTVNYVFFLPTLPSSSCLVLFGICFILKGTKALVWKNKSNLPSWFLRSTLLHDFSFQWVSACLWSTWPSSSSNESVITYCKNILMERSYILRYHSFINESKWAL